jgi:hypothetical protein
LAKLTIGLTHPNRSVPPATSSNPTTTRPLQRSFNPSNVNQTPAPFMPFTQADLLGENTPSEPPPGYTRRPGSTLTAAELLQQIARLEQILAVKKKGSLSIRALTLAGSIDAVQLLYVGLTQGQLTRRELPLPTYQHPNHGLLFWS